MKEDAKSKRRNPSILSIYHFGGLEVIKIDLAEELWVEEVGMHNIHAASYDSGHAFLFYSSDKAGGFTRTHGRDNYNLSRDIYTDGGSD